MIRKGLKQHDINNKTQFRFRGTDNTRIEALSDGIFAIAIALLVISSTMPESFTELMVFLKDLLPFSICMILLMLIWYQHYTFFIRYGFKDATIVAVNTLLLFLILFYIYPLKFLFKLLIQMFPALWTNDETTLNHLFTNVMPISEAPILMSIYGFGAAAIFYTLAWMYFIAWKRRDKLKLTKYEAYETKSSMISNILTASVPTFSLIISILFSDSRAAFSFAGMIYMVYPIIMPAFGYFKNKQTKKLLEEIKSES